MTTPTSTAASTNLVHAYRNLYRHALRAVHYSTPARYQIRDILRESFRASSSSLASPQHLANTLRFLTRAAASNGTEHKILRNILHARFWTWLIVTGGGPRVRARERPSPWMTENTDVAVELRRRRGAQLHATVELLNRSMQLCLRT